MLVVSPWSKGGWVNSKLFDHTSLIQFIERRFADEHPGLVEPNIQPWRRALTGDLSSAFDFKTPNAALPPLPDVSVYMPVDYSGRRRELELGVGQTQSLEWELTRSARWYDLIVSVANDPDVRVQLAGRIETGQDGVSDPAFGR
jgi:phospholipase C